jgi:hypothetical protein
VATLPPEALVTKDGSTHVFVVEDGRAVERVVTTGAAREQKIAVPLGVKAGDKVVVAPPASLTNGSYVEL